GLCIMLTWLGIWNIGNAAHVMGFLFGASTGFASQEGRFREAGRIAVTSVFIISLLPAIWCPWQQLWCASRAISASVAHDWNTAERYYRRALKLGADPTWAYESLAIRQGTALP